MLDVAASRMIVAVMIALLEVIAVPIVALHLGLAQQRVIYKTVMVANNAMVNLVESTDVEKMRRPKYLPLQIYGQKNVFIAEQDTVLHHSFFSSNVFCENSSMVSSFNPSFSCSKPSTIPEFTKKNKKKNIRYTSSYENSLEYRTLISMFSSGVRLHELSSIATILSSLLPSVKEPNRDTKRSFPLLIQWFHDNWELVLPMLSCIQLRDENNQVIDGKREIYEKSLQNK